MNVLIKNSGYKTILKISKIFSGIVEGLPKDTSSIVIEQSSSIYC